MPRLIRIQPGAPEETVELKPGASMVGRALENAVSVLHSSLSRHHARIDVDADGAYLTDLGSRNGTALDGLPVRNARLKNGAVVRFGEVEFRFEDDRPDQQKASAAYQEELQRLLASYGENDGASAIRIPAATGAERAEKKLDILLTVCQLLSSPEPLDKLLSKVFDLLFQIFDIDRAVLLLADETGALTPRLSRSARGDSETAAFFSRQIADQAFKSPQGILSSDATTDERFSKSESVLSTGIRSSMCVPVRSKETTVGVLYVDHLSVLGRYGQEDLDFLAGFASQAAVAIENSRLYSRLEEEAVRRSSLLRFFPPTLVGPLLASAKFGLEPVEADITVLFSDISGFTSLSSRLSSREVVDLLNGYFPVMAEIVFRHEGTLEKYIGDALMAIWGAPTPHADDADRAVAAALEMQEAMVSLNAARKGGPELAIHIGLNSGPVTFGNIGSPDYVQFAAIGDTTNVASRVSNVAGPGEIVMSGTTFARIAPARWDLEALPPASVKGKDKPIEVHRLRGRSRVTDGQTS